MAAYCIGIVFRDRLGLVLQVVLFSYVFLIYDIRGKRYLMRRLGNKGYIVLPLFLLVGAVLGRMQATELRDGFLELT